MPYSSLLAKPEKPESAKFPSREFSFGLKPILANKKYFLLQSNSNFQEYTQLERIYEYDVVESI